MSYFVYILECADGSYYVGITNDLEKRLKAHNETPVGAKYTRSRRPVKLVFQEEYPSKSEALRREAEIKNWKRTDKQSLVRDATVPLQPSSSTFNIQIRPHARARHIRLTVYPDRRVVVTVPPRVNEKKVAEFINEKSAWIQKQLAFFEKTNPTIAGYDEKKSYTAYKDSALRLVKRRIEYFNKYYNFSFSGIKITNTKTQWGSCSAQRVLSFNFRIAFVEPKLADYLIVHELCHLREFNHSPRFWKLVELAIPDYKTARAELKRQGFVLY